ncbi:hypothetical protein [Streptomyces sp. SKN60]|uniref:hypothetical protein n=1 Tax=Streptomyces sp. SKN60 TaxID=2855506 RepID=UPI0022456E06|nr:hypothetical protein [Streptomyces sp. SKN60]
MRAIRAAASAALLAPLATAALVLAAPGASADDGGFGPADLGLLKDELLLKEDDAAPKDDGGGAPPKDAFPKDTAPKDGGTGHNITSFGFSVTPSTVAPGGTVTLKADGCEVPSVKVESGVFDTVTLNEGHQGTATVDFDAKVGAQYEVTFDCKGERGTTTLTIAGGGGHKPDTSTGARKGVRAGFGSGGTDGIGTTETVTGGVLIAGALGAAVVLMRRREPTGTDGS